MRCLILAAGRFDDRLRADIAADREPRLDVFELAKVLSADVIDFGDVERSTHPAVKLAARASKSAAVALMGFMARKRYDTFFTTGEDIGLPLAALVKASFTRASHTMIAHTLFPDKKRVFFRVGGVGSTFDRILVYSTSEERLAVDVLGLPASKVQRIYYHADQRFFRPDDTPREPGLICAAGQLLRDYDTLIEAVRDLPGVRLQVAAGSPWIDSTLKPRGPLPENVSWGKHNRFELRQLYARAQLAVVPILQNEYQTGIATILEMMAMGKCIVVTKTRGQTDTIVDGETGVYVPPGDPAATRAAIQRLLANPEDIARIGNNARRFMETEAGLDVFVERVAESVRAGHRARFGASG